jgi:myo-inositol-1-phosphate synthase
MPSIKVAVVGVGNCASSLVQCVLSCKSEVGNECGFLSSVGGYKVADIEFVAAFDVDVRKTGRCIGRAVQSAPNCTPLFVSDGLDDYGPTVLCGPILDGVSPHMIDHPDKNCSFWVSKDHEAVDVAEQLKLSQADILINYLPVGSQQATEYYANCCLDAGVAFLNCIPVFIASDPEWERRFVEKGLPLIGDDMKSQFGASILSQILQEAAESRGVVVDFHIQRNVGGNTDFLNMESRDRVVSKKQSKENVINHVCSDNNTFVHAGPSEYIQAYQDTKIANIHMKMRGVLGSPIELNAQLTVVDSPNSAGVVVDAIRYLKIAKDRGMTGSLRGPSAFTQKSPPVPLTLSQSVDACRMFCAT